jgi:hypothetical protein
MKKEMTSPFIPQSIDDNLDYQRQISEDHDSDEGEIQLRALDLRRPSIQCKLVMDGSAIRELCDGADPSESAARGQIASEYVLMM